MYGVLAPGLFDYWYPFTMKFMVCFNRKVDFFDIDTVLK